MPLPPILLGAALLLAALPGTSLAQEETETAPSLILGAGGFAASNPYASAKDDVTFGAFPYVQYTRGRFQADITGVSVTALQTRGIALDLLASPRWVVFDPEETEDFSDLDRDVGLDLGLRASWSGGPVTLSAQYAADVSHVSEGEEAVLRIEGDLPLGQRTALGLTAAVAWKDESLSTFSYGLSAKDASPAGIYAFGENGVEDQTFVPSIGARLSHRFTPRVFGIVAVEAEFFGAEITDSPLMEEDHAIAGFVGLARAFR